MSANVTVVIPAHNAANVIGEQLAALGAQVGAGDFEVVVALNNCTDGTGDVVHGFAQTLELVVVAANGQPSAAQARNRAASSASGDLLLFCDADDEVGPSWVAEMAEALRTADLVGGRILLDQRECPAWIREHFYARLAAGTMAVHDGRIPYPIGASLGCRREAFNALGGFDESFVRAGGEEVDLVIRMVQAGYRLGYAPAATLRYRPRTSFRALLAQRRSYARGDALLAAKHGYAPLYRGRVREAEGVLRTVAWLAVKQGERRPQALLARGLVRHYRAREARRIARVGGVGTAAYEPGAEGDFVVPLTCPVIGGLGFRATSRESARWYAREGVEQLSLAIFLALAAGSGAVVDCGANVGTFAVGAALSRRSGAGGVVAFEPDSRARAALGINLARHGVSSAVDVRAEAVGAEAARVTFFEHDPSVVSGLARSPLAPDAGLRRAVEVVPLDEAVPDPVAVLKIDVEGAEVGVLDGARAVLGRSPEIAVMVEVNPAALDRFGATPGQILDRFPAQEWAGWLVEDARQDQSARVSPLWTNGLAVIGSADRRWYANALFVRRHRETELAEVCEAAAGLHRSWW